MSEERHKSAYEKTAKLAYDAGVKDFRLFVPYEKYALVVCWHKQKHGHNSRYQDIAEMLIKNPFVTFKAIMWI